MTIKAQHIPFARLADLAEKRLSANDESDAREHLAGCQSCAGQAAELLRVTQLMRADTSVDAPRDVLLSAIGMFSARRTEEKTPGLLRRVLATLSFDSGSWTPAFGVRSGQAAPARQLLFTAGDVSVDLRLAQGGEGCTISGQVLGECDGGHVEIVREGETVPTVRAELNDLCEFLLLPPIPTGDYTLRLRLGDTEIEIPGLNLRA